MNVYPKASSRYETNLKPGTPKDVANETDKKLFKKAAGYDLISGQIMEEVPGKVRTKLTQLINAAFRLHYVPMQWRCV